MFCKNPNCKHEIPDDSVFCPDCGQKQNDAPIHHDTPQNHHDENSERTSQGFDENDNEISFIRDGVKYYRIGTPSKDKVVTHNYRWRHADNCSGNLFLGDNALCLCHKCGEIAKISNWQIVETTDDGISYAKISKDSSKQIDLQKAVDIAAEITTIAGVEWLNKYTDSLMQELAN